MSSKKQVPLKSTLDELVDLFNQGIYNAAEAVTETENKRTELITDVQEAILLLCASLGIDRDNVSFVKGTEPGAATEGDLGAMFDNEGEFISLRYESGSWEPYDIFLLDLDSPLDPTNDTKAPSSKDVSEFTGITSFGNRVAEWARAENFEVTSGDTISESGVTLPKDIEWPDGKTGTLSNLTVTNGNIIGLRFNYDGTTKYITLAVNYSGQFPQATYTPTGF